MFRIKKLMTAMVCVSIVMGNLYGGDKPVRKIGGFIQTVVQKTEDNKALTFGFDRVRIIAKGELNPKVNYKLQIDFNKTSTSTDKDGDTQGIIKDAVLIYSAISKVKVSVGKFKTPIGMEFNTSGMGLDIVKRGLGQKLVFERNAGAMVHGKKITPLGFGFNLGLFNAGPNGANNIGDAASGQDYTFAGRVSVSPAKTLYAEASFGSALTSVDSTESVTIVGVGVKAKVMNAIQLKGEFMSRTDANNSSADGTDLYAQATYQLTPAFQAVVKHEILDVTNDAKDQGNTTVGINIFLNPKHHRESKIQINYVASDKEGASALQVMFQGAF